MKEFYVDFLATVIIKAENEGEADRKFWKWLPEGLTSAEVDTIEQTEKSIEEENP